MKLFKSLFNKEVPSVKPIGKPPPPPEVRTHDIVQVIKKIAYLEGDFTLSSGKKSRYYFDKYKFETRPEILVELSYLFAEHIRPTTTLIACTEIGGIPLATATSLLTNVPFVIIRKEKKNYGTSNLIEGTKIEHHDRILLIEDVVTTGKSIIEAADNIVKSTDAVIECIVSVIDRQEGGKQNIEQAGYKFESLFDMSKFQKE